MDQATEIKCFNAFTNVRIFTIFENRTVFAFSPATWQKYYFWRGYWSILKQKLTQVFAVQRTMIFDRKNCERVKKRGSGQEISRKGRKGWKEIEENSEQIHGGASRVPLRRNWRIGWPRGWTQPSQQTEGG